MVGVINLYYPNALLFGTICLILLNKLWWNFKVTQLIIVFICFVLLVFLIPFIIDCCFGRVLGDLYLRGYRNIFFLFNYYKEIANVG